MILHHHIENICFDRWTHLVAEQFRRLEMGPLTPSDKTADPEQNGFHLLAEAWWDDEKQEERDLEHIDPFSSTPSGILIKGLSYREVRIQKCVTNRGHHIDDR